MGRITRLGVAAALSAAAALTLPIGEAVAADQPEPLTIVGGPTSATDPSPVGLEADLYLPATSPAPAVVLAHGFGGSKDAVAQQAQQLADGGFVVLAYTARGFGGSGGTISMNSPRYEVADARAAIDELAERSEVVQDGPDDPRVGIAGGSYGGALALLTAGYDQRIDAVAADITWNDLRTSLFGQSAKVSGLGVFKQWWAGGFFGVGLEQPGARATPCGRFSPDWCAAFDRAATSGTTTPADERLLRRSSPMTVTDRITAPTLIGVGQADSLFPLAQGQANYSQITAANPETPVKLVWHGGGHDGGVDESERLLQVTQTWMTAHLSGGPPVATDTEVTLSDGALGADSRREPALLELPQFPVPGVTEVILDGGAQSVRAPAGGAPAAISSFPGIGGLAAQLGMVPPGQGAVFESAPVTVATTLVGSGTADLQVSSAEPVRDVALFAQLRVVTAAGTEIAPQGLVAPIRLDRIGPEPTTMTVDLPGVATRISAGDRLRLVVATTDAAYRLPDRPAIYDIGLADPVVRLPTAPEAAVVTAPLSPALLLALPIIVVVGLLVLLLRPRAPHPRRREEYAGIPVVVEGLAKTYRGGVKAALDVSFQVPPGVVLGLLGPNGAGKTTTMRMMMGLIRPSAGAVYLFGERIYAGAPVLSRVGALVEGAGFLPHLSGRTNLELFWRSTGRAGDPQIAQVLEIAGLGDAVDRPVKSYSQGMRQRLGIAQAMLGMPDLLILDEPTNGLDPPQIREMREVLRSYATAGRTVIVSSHLLAEVEVTCSHVVVMQRGRSVAAGEVGSWTGADHSLEDVFLEIVGTDHTVGGSL